MKYVVTGHHGFIGKALYDRLKSFKHEVIGWDVKDWPQAGYLPCNLEGVDRIFHLGAVSGIMACESDPVHAVKMNVHSTVAWAHAAKAVGASLVFASSCAAAAPRPEHVYGSTKKYCETLLSLIYPNKTAILRFSNVYGPGSMEKESVVARMCKDALTKRSVTVHGCGEQLRDFVHVEDVVNSCIGAPSHGTYAVRSGKQTPIWDMGDFIATTTGAMVVHDQVRTGSRAPHDPSPVLVVGPYRELWDGIKETIGYFRKTLETDTGA